MGDGFDELVTDGHQRRLPADLVHALISHVGLDETETAAMSMPDALARLQRYWTEAPDCIVSPVRVHCAGDLRGEVERQLVAAARSAGAPHLVHISIVGADRVPLGFYRTRLAAERAIEASELPWTILRSTQFHDLIRFLLALSARLPIMVVPDFSFQPIDVREVAGRLVELATGSRPAGCPIWEGRRFATPVT